MKQGNNPIQLPIFLNNLNYMLIIGQLMIIQNDQVFNLYYKCNLIVLDPFTVRQRRKSQISTKEKSEEENSYSESSDTRRN